MKQWKRLLAFVLSFCCIMSTCLSPVTAYATTDDGSAAIVQTTTVDFQGEQGSFEAAWGNGTPWTTSGMRSTFTVGTTVADAGLSVKDPVFWDPSRAFMGWMLCTMEEIMHDDGSSHFEYAQVEGTGLFTTAEALAYTIPNYPIYFVAQWDGNDDDYYSQMFIHGYGGEVIYNEYRWENDGMVPVECRTEVWGNYLKEGIALGTQTADYFSITKDPVKSGATFEGWAEFSVERTLNDAGYWDDRYTLVDNTLYTTAQINDRVVPENDFAYVAKWSDMNLEDYFNYGGPGGGGSGDYVPEGPAVHVNVQGNDGSFTLTFPSGGTMTNCQGFGNPIEIGISLAEAGYGFTDATFWDSHRPFAGWMACTWQEVTGDDGSTWFDLVQIKGTDIMTTAEMMAYEIPDYDIQFVAQWDGNDDDYYSQLFIHCYDGEITYNDIRWEDDEQVYVESRAQVLGRYLKEGIAIGTQISGDIELPNNPVKEGATFEGWAEFSIERSINEVGNTYDEYTLVSETLYTTAQMLERIVPENHVGYVAKWSDVAFEDYFNHGGSGGGDSDDGGSIPVVHIEGMGGTFQIATPDGSGTTDYWSHGLLEGRTLSGDGFNVTDPVFWDANRGFEGWIVCKEVEVTDAAGYSWTTFEQIEGTGLLTTAEILTYVIPSYNIMFRAQWAGDDYDYYSDVYITGYGVQFPATEIRVENGQVIRDEIMMNTWGNFLKENGEGIRIQTSDFFELTKNPTKDGATFEGWAEFKVIYTQNPDGGTSESYELVSNTIFTTEQMLTRPVPDYDVLYAAKWSDIALEDYYKNGGGMGPGTGNLVGVHVEGNGGTFDFTMGNDRITTDYVCHNMVLGMDMIEDGFGLYDAVFWDTNRAFLGWEVCVWVEHTDVEGNSWLEMEPKDDVGLLTTAEVMDYTITEEVIFRAVWAGDDADYYSQVYISGYDTDFTFTDIREEDGQLIREEITVGTWGNTLKENNENIATQTADYFALTKDPTKEGATFEGWAEFKVIYTENPDGGISESYELVSDILYTTAQMLAKSVPDYDVMFAAKWSDIPLEDYYKDGDSGDGTAQTGLIFNGNGGDVSFRYTIDGVLHEGAGVINEFHRNAADTVGEVLTNGDIEFISVQKECGAFNGWTVYACERIDNVFMPAGEELNVGDPEVEFIFLHTEEDEEGNLMDRYIGLVNAAKSTGVTTSQLMAMDGHMAYYIVATWVEDHKGAAPVMENIVDATETANGSYDSVVYCSGCGEELSRTQVPITITTQQPTVEGSDKDWKVDTKSTVTEVPDGVSDTYETIEDVKTALEDAAVNADDRFASEGTSTKVMDVELKVKNDEGVWEVVDHDNFPTEGVSILLPYPEGTGVKGFIFLVTHMITSGDLAGTVEILNAVREAAGLRVTVHSLSPIAITYQAEAEDPEVEGYTVSGNVTSYLDAEDEVLVELFEGESTESAYATATTDGTYVIGNVANGTYTMRVSKANHVTREYEITVVDGEVVQDVKICPPGDVTGDGKVNTMDVARIYAHVRKTGVFTDEYMFLCADVVGSNESVNSMDVGRVYAHVQKTNPLW